MILKSNNFKNNEMMDSQFTCDGRNISPHLQWESFPSETKSFCLTCIDPDAPGGDFVHWIVMNIPLSITEFESGAKVSSWAQEIENDFGYSHYGGPCPPSGIHRYVFTVTAMDEPRVENVTLSNFREKIKEHQIEHAQLIGLYSRRS